MKHSIRIMLLMFVTILVIGNVAQARIYDPKSGRFISRDPISYQGGMNQYAYCDNDPMNRIDPSGLKWYDSEMVSHHTGTTVDNVSVVTSIKIDPSYPEPVKGILKGLWSRPPAQVAALQTSWNFSDYRAVRGGDPITDGSYNPNSGCHEGSCFGLMNALAGHFESELNRMAPQYGGNKYVELHNIHKWHFGGPDASHNADHWFLVLIEPKKIRADIDCKNGWQIKKDGEKESVISTYSTDKYEAVKRNFAVADPYLSQKTTVNGWLSYWVTDLFTNSGWTIQ